MDKGLSQVVSSPAGLNTLAPAKVNLFLHVPGRRADGYHNIESLVSFASIGDHLSLLPGAGLALTLSGPFSAALGGEGDNLILKAARAFAARFEGATLGAFALDKHLPVASGIGGGSSDAAAALRLLAQANGIARDDGRLMNIARQLGADVPVCLDPALRMMRGLGHDLGPKLPAKPMPALLVNPGIGVSTAPVFAALGLKPGQERPGPAYARNDLAAPAIQFCPVIGDVLAMLDAEPGVSMVRMSGSGATCFALFAREADAQRAAVSITEAQPAWWVKPCTLLAPV